jgi:hypothetical protein
VEQVGNGGIQVRDTDGTVVAFVLSQAGHQAWVYAEAHRDLDEHQQEVREALGRRGGVTTKQMLENAEKGERQANRE